MSIIRVYEIRTAALSEGFRVLFQFKEEISFYDRE